MRSAPDFRLWSKLITKWSSEELLANNRNSGTMIFSHQVPSWCFKLNFNVDVSSKRCIWKNKFVILKTCKFYILLSLLKWKEILKKCFFFFFTWNWWLIWGKVINIIGSFWMEFKARDRTPSKIIVILLWFSTRCKWRFCKRLWIKLASHKVNKQLHKKAKQIRTVLLIDLAMMVLWLFKQLFVTRCPLLYFAMTLSRDTLSICAAAYCRSAQNRISRMWGADFSPTREWTFLKK